MMGAASEKQMAGCTGKAAFKTRRVAQRQATWMQRRWRSEKRRRLFDVYQCKFCGDWHIGNKKP